VEVGLGRPGSGQPSSWGALLPFASDEGRRIPEFPYIAPQTAEHTRQFRRRAITLASQNDGRYFETNVGLIEDIKTRDDVFPSLLLA
jgi:hypothetical protein